MIVIGIGKRARRVISWVQSLQENRKKQEENRQETADFLQDIRKARTDLEIARHNYNFAETPALLECYIYEIKAAETRLDYCLKRAKAAGISIDCSPAMLLLGREGEGCL